MFNLSHRSAHGLPAALATLVRATPGTPSLPQYYRKSKRRDQRVGHHACSFCRQHLQQEEAHYVWSFPTRSTLTLSHSSVRESSFHRSSSTDTAGRPGATPAICGDAFPSFWPLDPVLAPSLGAPPLRKLDPGAVAPVSAVAAVATLPDSSGAPPSSSANGSRPTHPKTSSTSESPDVALAPPTGPSPP